MQITQKELHSQLRAEAASASKKLAALLKPLDSAKLNEHPEPERWSIGQVLEHLTRGGELFEAPTKALLGAARRDAAASARNWKPSLLGKMIAGSIRGRRPLKSPKIFEPGPTPRPGIVDAFLAREMDFLKEMDDAQSYDWRALRLRSPALPKWAPKMNLGDAFRIHVAHVTRHSGQIERLVEKL